MISPDLSFAIKHQDRYPVIVLTKAVTAFLSAIVPVNGRQDCKTLDTQAKHIRISNRNQLLIQIAHKQKDGRYKFIDITARQLAYFITHKRFPVKGIVLACYCGFYHCINCDHFVKETSGSNGGGVKRNRKRDYRKEGKLSGGESSGGRSTGGKSSGGYKVYSYTETIVTSDPSQVPLWADLDTPTINVKATRID